MELAVRKAAVAFFLASVFSGCTDATHVGDELAEVKVPTSECSWPWWRGPNRNGVADGPAPFKWDEQTNVVWKAAIPGRGHSSPTVVDGRIFLTTADEAAQVQSAVCYDRQAGQKLWTTELHRGGFPTSGMHNESSHASCSPAVVDGRVFAAFLNAGRIHASALDVDGEILWQKDLGPFRPQFGYTPSPAIHESAVIIAADHGGGGFLTSLDQQSGDVNWTTPRPKASTYSSPVVAEVAGKKQVLISGGLLVCSYDPDTGDELWRVNGTAEATCGTMVWEDDVVFATGGYPQSETLCLRADGTGKVVWRVKQKAYVPSMLVHDEHLYVVDGERGVAYCLESSTGAEKWKERLTPKLRSSPVLANGHVYITNVHGRTWVIRATPEKFDLVAENQLGEEAYATPTICGGQIFLRTATGSGGSRKETLHCIGSGD